MTFHVAPNILKTEYVPPKSERQRFTRSGKRNKLTKEPPQNQLEELRKAGLNVKATFLESGSTKIRIRKTNRGTDSHHVVIWVTGPEKKYRLRGLKGNVAKSKGSYTYTHTPPQELVDILTAYDLLA